MNNFKDELDLMKSCEAIIQANSYAILEKKLSILLDNSGYRSNLENNTTKLSHDVKFVLDNYTKLIIDY